MNCGQWGQVGRSVNSTNVIFKMDNILCTSNSEIWNYKRVPIREVFNRNKNPNKIRVKNGL